jgi:hypothetical protein
MVEDRAPHRGQEEREGHPLALERRHHPHRVERAEDDPARADQHPGQHDRVGRAVEHRQQ